jgi:hypothetical protein
VPCAAQASPRPIRNPKTSSCFLLPDASAVHALPLPLSSTASQKETVRQGDDLAWAHVDEATGASSSLQGRNFPRRAHFESVYSRRWRGTAAATQEEGIMEEEDQDNEGNEQDDEDIEEYMPNDDEEVDDFAESPHSSHTQADGEENAMDDIDFGDI